MRPYLFLKLSGIRVRAREGCNFKFSGDEFLSALINSLTKPALPNAHRNGELTLKISQLAGMMLYAVPGETGMSLL